jgi:hypothetical protein
MSVVIALREAIEANARLFHIHAGVTVDVWSIVINLGTTNAFVTVRCCKCGELGKGFESSGSQKLFCKLKA